MANIQIMNKIIAFHYSELVDYLPTDDCCTANNIASIDLSSW